MQCSSLIGRIRQEQTKNRQDQTRRDKIRQEQTRSDKNRQELSSSLMTESKERGYCQSFEVICGAGLEHSSRYLQSFDGFLSNQMKDIPGLYLGYLAITRTPFEYLNSNYFFLILKILLLLP